jgi:hypothetical protein
MDTKTFIESLHSPVPPHGISIYLQSLWYDAKGHWDKAHELIQDLEDQHAAWIHGYLHRKEGDAGNAGYWYAKATRSFPHYSLKEEWNVIVNELILSTRNKTGSGF